MVNAVEPDLLKCLPYWAYKKISSGPLLSILSQYRERSGERAWSNGCQVVSCLAPKWKLSILPLVGQYLAPDGTLFPIATLLDAEKILASGQWRKHLQPGYWRAARKCKGYPESRKTNGPAASPVPQI